jgi:hypothetical protein
VNATTSTIFVLKKHGVIHFQKQADFCLQCKKATSKHVDEMPGQSFQLLKMLHVQGVHAMQNLAVSS